MSDDITAEYEVAELVNRAVLRANARCRVAAKTDLGRVRENNEDKFEFYVPSDPAQLAARGQIYLVCDGMGGHAAGQIASELACKTFIDVYLSHPSEDPAAAMRAAVTAADRFVKDVGRAIPARRGMGSTLSGLVLLQDRAYVVQVGDSRVYRLSGEEFSCLTEDHTWVNDAIRAGAVTEEEAKDHPYRHALTRAIGGDDFPAVPDIFEHPLHDGDVFVLCSDGVMNHVSDAEIETVVRNNGPAEIAWKLVGMALLGGGSDNTTVLAVSVDEIERFLG